MKSKCAALLILALSGCASTHHQILHGRLFAELRPEERVHIRYGCLGCFHNDSYDFKFEQGGAGITVRITALGPFQGGVTTTPKPLGSLALSRKDIQGLDRLVQFYRTHTDGSCTTSDYITIEHFRPCYGPKAPPIATERYMDFSCATEDISGITTLRALADRLQKHSL